MGTGGFEGRHRQGRRDGTGLSQGADAVLSSTALRAGDPPGAAVDALGPPASSPGSPTQPRPLSITLSWRDPCRTGDGEKTPSLPPAPRPLDLGAAPVTCLRLRVGPCLTPSADGASLTREPAWVTATRRCLESPLSRATGPALQRARRPGPSSQAPESAPGLGHARPGPAAFHPRGTEPGGFAQDPAHGVGHSPARGRTRLDRLLGSFQDRGCFSPA